VINLPLVLERIKFAKMNNVRKQTGFKLFPTYESDTEEDDALSDNNGDEPSFEENEDKEEGYAPVDEDEEEEEAVDPPGQTKTAINPPAYLHTPHYRRHVEADSFHASKMFTASQVRFESGAQILKDEKKRTSSHDNGDRPVHAADLSSRRMAPLRSRPRPTIPKVPLPSPAVKLDFEFERRLNTEFDALPDPNLQEAEIQQPQAEAEATPTTTTSPNNSEKSQMESPINEDGDVPASDPPAFLLADLDYDPLAYLNKPSEYDPAAQQFPYDSSFSASGNYNNDDNNNSPNDHHVASVPTFQAEPENNQFANNDSSIPDEQVTPSNSQEHPPITDELVNDQDMYSGEVATSGSEEFIPSGNYQTLNDSNAMDIQTTATLND
jgi:hypothetical protein